MRTFRVVMAALAVAAALGVWAAPGTAAAGGGAPAAAPAVQWVPGAVLVEFKSGVTADAALRHARAAGTGTAKLVRAADPATSGGRTIVLVRSRSLGVAALQRLFAADPSVVRTSPDYLRHTFASAPDDPGLAGQWGLFQTGVLDAWQTTTGTRDVVVADVDTGLSLGHPEFATSLWHNAGEVPGNHVDDDGNGYVDDAYGWDATQNDGEPMDFYGHGTHTAGIVAAAAGNGIGVAGVAPGVSVMPVQAFGEDGYATDAEILAAMDYVIHEKTVGDVDVVAINASWGGGGDNALLKEAIEQAGAAGIVFVAAAGNYHLDIDRRPVYPAAFDCPTMITVAATDQRDRLATFSDYGATAVDLGAPGVNIGSTMGGDGYARHSGTSMAAPFVTAAVALCAAEWPGETAAQRVARVLSSARPVSSMAGRCVTGGRLDVAAALRGAPAAGDVTAPVTTVLGADGLTHDATVNLRLAAIDESGGSGVAVTQWRVGDGGWHSGTFVAVVPPDRRRAVVTVSYRSTDRAGNAETPGSVAVRFDRTRPADDAYPGVTLPASPVHDDVAAGSDRGDVFSVRLHAGESMTLRMTASPAARILVGVFRAGTRYFSFWGSSAPGRVGMATSDGLTPGFGEFGSVIDNAVDTSVGDGTLAWRSSADRTYRVVVYAESGSGPYTLDYRIVPEGVDVVPPSWMLLGSEFARWNNFPVWLNVVASDGGSGVGQVETSQDGGLTWAVGNQATVNAPADHGNDGTHAVLLRARDVAGNVSQATALPIGIDTEGPRTTAWGPRREVAPGARWTLRYAISDMCPYVRDPQLVITSVASGRVVRKYGLGTPSWTNAHITVTMPPCRLPTGEYEVKVAGVTRDMAGNKVVEAVCARTLRVK